MRKRGLELVEAGLAELGESKVVSMTLLRAADDNLNLLRQEHRG